MPVSLGQAFRAGFGGPTIGEQQAQQQQLQMGAMQMDALKTNQKLADIKLKDAIGLQDDDRLNALATDIRTARIMWEQGQPEQAMKRIQSRKDFLIKENPNADTSHTDAFLIPWNEGNKEKAFEALGMADMAMFAAGRSKPMGKAQFGVMKQMSTPAKRETKVVGKSLFEKDDQGTWVRVGKDVDEVAKIVTPAALIEDLPPEIAPKAKAAYEAAGGGKDGIAAMDKVIGRGEETIKRSMVPQSLQRRFKDATPEQMIELQSAVDTGKTVEAGFKEASKIRTEQKRMVKAQGFNDRAVELLTSILENDELGDVLGSIEGAIDFRFQDSESELIADIEEAGNILTADNLSLMSGVLSETDIKILKNLAGGGLNRKRSKDRFVKDVTSIRDKLAGAVFKSSAEAPPANTNAQGWKLNVDAQGNKAYVGPNGEIEEV